MNMKQHVANLYQQLGNDELQAWYKTLLESQEFNQIEPVVTQMVRRKQSQEERISAGSQPSPMEEQQPASGKQQTTAQKSKKGAKRSSSRKTK